MTVRAFTDRVRLGDSGLAVSPVCIGMVSDPRTISAAFDAGARFFFVSADMHWPLYEGTRAGLRDLFRGRRSARDEVIVAAASYVSRPEFVIAPFHELIDAVPGLGRIDVTVVGGVQGRETALAAAFAAHRRAELVPGVRATGASFHDRRAAAEWIEQRAVEIAFVRYNTAHCGAEAELFPTLPPLRAAALFTFKSTAGYLTPAEHAALGRLAHGWRPDVTDHYRFALTRPEVDGVLCSPRTVSELEALGRALSAGPLPPEQILRMKALSRAHYQRLRAQTARTHPQARSANP